jgi:hypothetical protein
VIDEFVDREKLPVGPDGVVIIDKDSNVDQLMDIVDGEGEDEGVKIIFGKEGKEGVPSKKIIEEDLEDEDDDDEEEEEDEEVMEMVRSRVRVSITDSQLMAWSSRVRDRFGA